MKNFSFSYIFDCLFNTNVDGKYLGVFRIIFGLAFIKETFRVKESIFPFYLEPDTLFKWPFFEWVELLPEQYLYLLSSLLILSAFMILLGFFTQFFSIIASFIYAYFFFLDRSYYNNHYYLILLIVIILSFVKSDTKWSLKELFFKTNGTVPVWNVFVFRVQFAIVYLYGATAKFNADWLSGRTMKASIDSEAYQGLKQLFPFNKDILILFLTHAGWIFDLTVPLLLLHKKGKYVALPFLVIFHTINGFNLNIGVFPFLMMGATIVYWGDGLREVLNFKVIKSVKLSITTQCASFLLVFYLMFQFLFTLRHFLIKGDYNVTGEGYNFSWKMKGNAIELKRYDIYCFDLIHKTEYKIPLNLHKKQYSTLSSVPLSNIPFAQYISNQISKQYHVNKDSLKVNAFIKISLNGSDDFYLIDTSYNLLMVDYPTVRHCEAIVVNKLKK
jgi:uncharacterized membrane protein YphA (DoxX/SURF4 family)